MKKSSEVWAVCNQKGGTGKTAAMVSLGIGLARAGKRVLLVDVNAQDSMTASLGYPQPDQMEKTLATVLGHIVMDKPHSPGEGVLRHEEGADLLPASMELSDLEVTLVNIISRETILQEYLKSVREEYGVILLLLDRCPSRGCCVAGTRPALTEPAGETAGHQFPGRSR